MKNPKLTPSVAVFFDGASDVHLLSEGDTCFFGVEAAFLFNSSFKNRKDHYIKYKDTSSRLSEYSGNGRKISFLGGVTLLYLPKK
jgi:precorrin-6B methylase 1